MADDMLFGDIALFDEFEKEREPSGSFLIYENEEGTVTNDSRFVFQENSESSSDSEDEQKQKVEENSVAYAVGKIKKQSAKSAPTNGNKASSDGESSEEDDATPVVNEDRLSHAANYKLNFEKDEQKQKVEENSVAYAVGKIKKQSAKSAPTNGNKASSDGESSEEDDATPVVNEDRLSHAANYKLNFERNKFKRFCNILDSTRKYRSQVEEYIHGLLEKEQQEQDLTLPRLALRSTVPSCAEINDKIPVDKRTDKMFQAHKIIGCCHFYGSYMLDALGWPLVEFNPSLTDSWDIPTQKPKCWNCDGDHMMTECKEPRDQRKISENRKQFMASSREQQPSGPKGGRYHVDASQDPRFSKFKPGTISEELRSALGYDEDQLPLYIYRMRALGYPPGWMEDAKGTPGLAMFDEHGNDPDESPESGTLDVEKIIEYPGFTTPMPDHVADESEFYCLPQLQPHQLKATLQANTRALAESMKRVNEEEEDQRAKRVKLNSSDMDLDDEESNLMIDPPLPAETPPRRPPPPNSTPPPTPDENTRTSLLSRESSVAPSDGRSGSPTLEELEQQYQALQHTLLEGEDSQTGDSGEEGTGVGDDTANAIELDSADDIDPAGTSICPIEITNDSVDSCPDDFEFVKPKLVKCSSTTSIQTFGELGSGSPRGSAPGTPCFRSIILQASHVSTCTWSRFSPSIVNMYRVTTTTIMYIRYCIPNNDDICWSHVAVIRYPALLHYPLMRY
ncbi:ZCHC8-like protein [Mya arenaria]|uniref:ZCHC8-like protein n=1 Tax=Mya arenaria TaxID=6604 RepID=A0ABY7E1H5_MYAAR|nr:ZCHC8-like protein [Mya arenaria]